MKRKLHLSKETLRTLSAEHLEQVAGGGQQIGPSFDACDAPMYLGAGVVTNPAPTAL